jgi:hypothetical protein
MSIIMNELDLNINNYSLEDILSLFKLPLNFDENGLKQAKKQVLMTHPDKSRMDKELFIFFSSAYRLLYKVYKFRVRNNEDTGIDRQYSSTDIDCDEDNKDVWKSLSSHKQFATIFNKMFEKNMVNSVDGYGDWLKEEEFVSTAKNRDEMNTLIDERKRTLRAITVYNGFQETTGFSGTDLVGNDCNYRSNMFSSLQYDDLKQAYTESVVPVSNEDYEQREKFQTVDEMKRARHVDETIRVNDCDPFATKRREAEEDDASRAFQLAKQDEEMRIIRSNMASNCLRIVN